MSHVPCAIISPCHHIAITRAPFRMVAALQWPPDLRHSGCRRVQWRDSPLSYYYEYVHIYTTETRSCVLRKGQL